MTRKRLNRLRRKYNAARRTIGQWPFRSWARFMSWAEQGDPSGDEHALRCTYRVLTPRKAIRS